MKHAERKEVIDQLKAMMEELNPEFLAKGKDKQTAEGYYRWHLLQLLADIGVFLADVADSQGRMAYCYSEMLEIQRSKSGVAPRPTGNGK